MKPGSLVECIENFSIAQQRLGINVPVKGEMYTVREILKNSERVSITLEEIINEPRQYKQGFGECSFQIEAFREVQPQWI